MVGGKPPPLGPPWKQHTGVGAVAASATCLQRTEYVRAEEGAGASRHRNLGCIYLMRHQLTST